jgi:hypothetical protein
LIGCPILVSFLLAFSSPALKPSWAIVLLLNEHKIKQASIIRVIIGLSYSINLPEYIAWYSQTINLFIKILQQRVTYFLRDEYVCS